MDKFGLKHTDIQKIQQVFAQYDAIEKVIIYGSRAKGTYKNGSDIDLAIKGENIEISLLFKIETALDDLLLPYTIDLSILSKIDNQKLIEHINRVGEVFYNKLKI